MESSGIMRVIELLSGVILSETNSNYGGNLEYR